MTAVRSVKVIKYMIRFYKKQNPMSGKNRSKCCII